MIEDTIRDRYGENGVRVYNLIDGQKNTEQIMNEAGVSESFLMDILQFMQDRGVIKMKYPDSPKQDSAENGTHEQITIILPKSVKSKMSKYNINWTSVVSKLVAGYVAKLGKSSGKTKSRKAKKKVKAKAHPKKKNAKHSGKRKR